MATHTVIPSSSSASGFNYDVILSYQEEEEETIGNNFASKLYASLEKVEIKTFRDDENSKREEQISAVKLKGINESRCAVILFSRNYASSTRCLEELALMMESKEKLGQRVIPVFLMGVQGSDVRRQKGSFEEPFLLHQQRFQFQPEVVERWRSALSVAGELCGFNLKDIPHGDEEKLIKKIVKDVVKDVNPFPKSKEGKRETRPPVIKVPNDAMIENQLSTERMVQQMLEWILNPDPHFGIIGVYGMGGVGKTTLVKEVNNHFEKDLSKEGIPFEIVIMITVSATPNIRNIRTYISKRLGLPDNTGAEALFDALRKKRFLLILDDVWSKLKLQEIGIPNPRTHKGSKILVTSRSKDACTDMGAKKTIKIHPLSEAESWGLFVEVAGDHVVADEIKCFAKRIIGRCKGLPLAIVTVGHAMANRLGVGEWANAVREMELSTTDLRGMKEEVFDPLKFSFDRLENGMLRSLFLYFACFPEDFIIGEHEILNYCVGEGLVDNYKYGSLTAARNKGKDLITSLKIACMVEDGEHKGSVRMHDMMRELALWIVTSSESDGNSPKFLIRTGETVREAPQAYEWLNATRISFYWTSIEKFPELGGRCQKLTSLLLRNICIIPVIPPTNFLQHMDHLSVLDLSCNQMESLPDSLSCLVHLRVLRLQGCRDLRSLPALGMLQLLQVLDLNGCEGLKQKIQEYEWVGGLSNLRYLDVAFSTVSIPVGVISRLHKLEELRMLKAGNIKWRVSSAEDEKWDASETGREGQKDDHRSIIDVEELSHLTCLTSLTISFEDIIISDYFKTLANKIKSLDLYCCRVEKQDALHALNKSQNLQSLTIGNCLGLTCVRIGAMFTDIRNCGDLKEVIDGPYYKDSEVALDGDQDFVGKKKYLHPSKLALFELPKLERICVSLEPRNCFSQLGVIEIWYCKSLKMVFTKGMLHLLNNLEYINVACCERMEVIIGAEEEEEIGGGELEGRVVISPFPRLTALYLRKLPALHDVCSNHILHCPLLTDVVVDDQCPRLKKDPLNIQDRDGRLISRPPMELKYKILVLK
ncbi:disease resistance protein RPS2-like [Macadamia integrifolia]|uniref:disease resistance protein RPS2-like n=1 Tax=Macadamia integrifolia TaxID=60698 RepID=UPI001C4FFFEE|nr:disease resistance protein RPS2-like [Macadamia integrifolia]